MERHKEGYESEMEVSSVDYLGDEFTMQSSNDDELSDYNDTQQDSNDQKSKSRKSSTSTPSVNQVCMRAWHNVLTIISHFCCV